MNTANLRAYIIDALSAALDTSVNLIQEGTLAKLNPTSINVRVKILPRESTNPGLGPTGLREDGGLVQIDVIGAQSLTLAALESVGSSILTTFNPASSEQSFGKLVIWNSWANTLSEENPYLRLPIMLRWSVFYN